MTVKFFSAQDEFRKWLEENHKTEQEIVVGFYKLNSLKPSMTWSQSVDQALCFGWIDSIRKSIDSESYCIRFTPRRKNSIWSAINIEKIEQLSKAGLMTPEGQKAFEERAESKSKVYAYEQETSNLSVDYELQFKKHEIAWDFFVKQSPSYKKTIIHWIMSAKQEKTKQSRLEKIINLSEQNKKMT